MRRKRAGNLISVVMKWQGLAFGGVAAGDESPRGRDVQDGGDRYGAGGRLPGAARGWRWHQGKLQYSELDEI